MVAYASFASTRARSRRLGSKTAAGAEDDDLGAGFTKLEGVAGLAGLRRVLVRSVRLQPDPYVSSLGSASRWSSDAVWIAGVARAAIIPAIAWILENVRATMTFGYFATHWPG